MSHVLNQLSLSSRHLLHRDLLLKNNYSHDTEIPSFLKLVVHSSVSQTIQNKKHILSTLVALELLCGQKLTKTRAKKSLAQFKIRQGNLLGCLATLRSHHIERFLHSFLFCILPRNPFQLNKFESSSSSGNAILSFGITNYLLAPELENHYDLFENLSGFQITLVSTCRSKQEALLFLSTYQLPFIK